MQLSPAFFRCLVFLVGLLVFGLQISQAQPVPCTNPATMTSFCDEACIICDINGFTGRNNSTIQGQLPPGFCTNTAHNMQWIGFIAGSTNLSLNVTVRNCQRNFGLEVGIYQSLDCETFQLVSNCDGNIPNNSTQLFRNTVPLVVGQYYYFVMDGNGGDICDYTITVVSGTTNVSALTNSGLLSGETVVCADQSSSFSLNPPPGGTWITWSLDGRTFSAGTDTSISVPWTQPGTYQLCATASNVCDTAPPVCRYIQVIENPPTILSEVVCANACYPFGNALLCQSGTYQETFTASNGCDSLVRLNLTVLSAPQTNLELLVCEGDSVFLDGEAFFISGNYVKKITTANGCDSTVNLTVHTVNCTIEGEMQTKPSLCHGDFVGELSVYVSNGLPPFRFSWQKVGTPSSSGTGNISALHTTVRVSGLQAGLYGVTVNDFFGNRAIYYQEIQQPQQLAGFFTLSDYNGVPISCFGAADGTAKALLSGGTLPYTLLWSNGQTDSVLTGLSIGNIGATITDAHGCVFALDTALIQPLELRADFVFENPDCSGEHTGKAWTKNISGGRFPYQYQLNGGSYQSSEVFVGLSPGFNRLRIRDANGCMLQDSNSLRAPLIPHLDLEDDLRIDLADSIRLAWLLNIAVDSFVWNPTTTLSCTTCAFPYARPFTDTEYILKVVSADGCADTDSIWVRVMTNRRIFAPNVFSPGSAGNEFFTLYGGPEVVEITQLKIFSRWGELVFEDKNMPPNNPFRGWDGSFRKKNLSPATFVWVATVSYLDGFSEVLQGEVFLMR